MVELRPAAPTDQGSVVERLGESSDQTTADHSGIETEESHDALVQTPQAVPESKSASADQLPFSEWLDNRRLMMIAVAVLVGHFTLALFYTLYLVQAILFPIALAIILKLIFNPVVRRANKWGVPNFVGAAFVVGGVFGATVASIMLLSSPASEWIEDAPRHFRSVEYKLWPIKKPISMVTDAGEEVDKLTKMEGESKPLPVEVKQPGVIATIVDATGNVAVGVFLTLVLLYFMLAGGDRLLEKLVELAPAWPNKRNIVRLARDVQASMSRYLFATTCINIVLGIAIGVGMWLIGLPNPVLWGVMAACLNFIPYFGCVIGAVVVFLVGLISFDSAAHSVWAPLVYIFINSVEGYFITPSILGRSISLSPLAILISMILWGWIWGVGGMLIAVPILAAAKIACDNIQPLQPVGKLFGR